MAEMRVISADSHMTEPGDLWVERLDRKFRDDAPRVVKREGASGLAVSAPFVFVGPGFHQPDQGVECGFMVGSCHGIILVRRRGACDAIR